MLNTPNNTPDSVEPVKSAALQWAVVLVWMGVIFYFSAQSSLGGMQGPAWLMALRKSGHIIEYGTLGWLVGRALVSTFYSRSLRLSRRNLALVWLLGTIIATAYAATDEFHQTFVPRRGGHIEDVLVDMLSATAALGVLYIMSSRRLRTRAHTLEQT